MNEYIYFDEVLMTTFVVYSIFSHLLELAFKPNMYYLICTDRITEESYVMFMYVQYIYM